MDSRSESNWAMYSYFAGAGITAFRRYISGFALYYTFQLENAFLGVLECKFDSYRHNYFQAYLHKRCPEGPFGIKQFEVC